MDIVKEVRIVRYSLIIIAITSIPAWGALSFLYAHENSSEISIMSSFGKIILFDPKQIQLFEENTFYQNNDLSFQLVKPDMTWDIHTASDDFLLEELVSLQSKGYLGGVYLEKEHDKRFLITVFDIPKEDFKLNDYIENQILLINLKSDAKIVINQVSESNDWALFAVESSEKNKQHAEQLLFLKENRLYMLQYTGESPQTLSSDQKNDFKLIMDSFEVI